MPDRRLLWMPACASMTNKAKIKRASFTDIRQEDPTVLCRLTFIKMKWCDFEPVALLEELIDHLIVFERRDRARCVEYIPVLFNCCACRSKHCKLLDGECFCAMRRPFLHEFGFFEKMPF